MLKILIRNYDLTVRNPHNVEAIDNRTPREIISEIDSLESEATETLNRIKELL